VSSVSATVTQLKTTSFGNITEIVTAAEVTIAKLFPRSLRNIARRQRVLTQRQFPSLVSIIYAPSGASVHLWTILWPFLLLLL